MVRAKPRVITFAMGGDVDAAITTYKKALKDELNFLRSRGVREEDIKVINYTYRTEVRVDTHLIVMYKFDYGAVATNVENGLNARNDMEV